MPQVFEQGALSTTQKNMLVYFETHDIKYVAEDAVFKNLSTGEVYTGRAEIGAMLHFIYHVAFDARAEKISHIVTEDKAIVEAFFKGRHIGEINGLKATNREVDVPLCVSYDLQDGLIKEARIYMLSHILLQQLGTDAAKTPKTTYVVRDIFKLKFGHFKPVKGLLQEALDKRMLPESPSNRFLTDFTGDSYRLIMESAYDSLLDYESSLNTGMAEAEWQDWYRRFMEHVESSHREILKQIA